MGTCNHPDYKLYVGSPDSSADIVVRLKMDNGEIVVSFPAETRGFSLFFRQNALMGSVGSITGEGEGQGEGGSSRVVKLTVYLRLVPR